MSIYQTIVTARSDRVYLNKPLPEDLLRRILNAGRRSGSSKNTQPWHFIVVKDQAQREALAGCGRYTRHLLTAPVVIVIATDPGYNQDFDAGRAAQSMMLAAWGEGVGSCMATLHNEELAHQVLGVPAEKTVRWAMAFGYPDPQAPRNVINGLPPEKALPKVGRRPLSDVVHWEKW